MEDAPGGFRLAGLHPVRRPASRGGRRLPLDRPGPRRRCALGSGLGSRTLHHGPASRRLDCRPLVAPGRRLAATRPGHLRPHRNHPALRHRGARHRLRVRCPYLPAVRRRGIGGRLAEFLVPRRAVRARRGPHGSARRWTAERDGCAAPLVRAGTGASGILPRPPVPALRPLHRRPPSRLRLRLDVARAGSRVAAITAARRRRRRLCRVGGRAPPPTGMVEPGLRRQRMVTGHGDRTGGHRAVHRHLHPADNHPGEAGPPGRLAHVGGWRRRGGFRGHLRGRARASHSPGASRGRP